MRFMSSMVIATFVVATMLLLPKPLLADVTEADSGELAALIEAGAVVVDVRRPDEWQRTGLVGGSHPLTFYDASGQYDLASWLAELEQLVEPDQPLVLICRSGKRSSRVASLLDRETGYHDVHNVTGGIRAWLDEGRAVKPWQP